MAILGLKEVLFCIIFRFINEIHEYTPGIQTNDLLGSKGSLLKCTANGHQ